MSLARYSSSSLSLLALSFVGTAQLSGGPVQEFASPFDRLQEEDEVVTVTFTAEDYGFFSALHELPGHARITDLPLPGGRSVDLLLRPTSAMAPGARAVVVHADGSQEFVRPQVRCFFGHVEGGGSAFLGVAPNAVNGFVSLAGELYFLASGDTDDGRATIAHSSRTALSDASWCGNVADGNDRVHTAPGTDDAPGGQQALGGGPSIRVGTLFLECDHQFRNQFASNQAAIDYAALLVSASSSIYRRDVGATLEIPDGYLRVWNSTPPWGVVNDFGGLSPFRNWWSGGSNPDGNLPRTLVHLLTSPVFGGVAYLDVLCSNNSGYALSSVNGSFPFPVEHTSSSNWDLVVLSHELGHNFGSPHTFNYSPPIECVDGTGPDSGTIMSYCHQNPGGISNVGIRFHHRVQQLIRNDVSNAGCMTTVPFQVGDYDVDGAIDLDDALAANAILNQGFQSIAAEEALDVDADGNFDQDDVDQLNFQVGGAPAFAVMFNGSGSNPELYQPVNVPLLGGTWTSQIFALLGTPTAIVAYSGGTEGIFLPLGELLVDPTSNFLFSNFVVSDGFWAVHDLPVPFSSNLIGKTARLQAFTTTQAMNAIDVRVNFY